MCVAALCVVILLWKVIPVFASMFGSVGMTLPLPTRIVIGVRFLNSWWAISRCRVGLLPQVVLRHPSGRWSSTVPAARAVLGDVLQNRRVALHPYAGTLRFLA
jgi:hypothetical protein